MPPTQSPLIESPADGLGEEAIRALVHKQHCENVLLTGIRARDDRHFVCTGRIPASHPFFTDRGRTPREDILFYTEVGRQASLAVSHAFLKAAIDDIFVFERSQAAITESTWRRSLDAACDLVSIEIEAREIVRRKEVVTRVVADHTMSVGGTHVFTGTGAWTIQSAALFRRLRRASLGSGNGHPLTEATAASTAAVADPAPASTGNVVLARPEFDSTRSAVVSSLIVDRTHRYFFDHPCDHVPGMLLLEGCAQLAATACAEVGAVPRGVLPLVADYQANFTQFVECDRPVTLSATVNAAPDGRPGALMGVDIAIIQAGVLSGTARLTVVVPV